MALAIATTIGVILALLIMFGPEWENIKSLLPEKEKTPEALPEPDPIEPTCFMMFQRDFEQRLIDAGATDVTLSKCEDQNCKACHTQIRIDPLFDALVMSQDDANKFKAQMEAAVRKDIHQKQKKAQVNYIQSGRIRTVVEDIQAIANEECVVCNSRYAHSGLDRYHNLCPNCEPTFRKYTAFYERCSDDEAVSEFAKRHSCVWEKNYDPNTLTNKIYHYNCLCGNRPRLIPGNPQLH